MKINVRRKYIPEGRIALGPRTKFPYRLWHWTRADESLFDLSKEELAIFADFVALAS